MSELTFSICICSFNFQFTTQPMTLSERCSWDPTICQTAMCKMNNNSFVLRGILDVAPYTHVVRIYRKDGSLQRSCPSRCCHDWSIGMQCTEIGVTTYIAESCPDCAEIRLYSKEEGFKGTVFADKAYAPGKIRNGPKGSVFVCDRNSSNVLKLDRSSKQFQITSEFETGASYVNGMCFVEEKEMLVVTVNVMYLSDIKSCIALGAPKLPSGRKFLPSGHKS